MESWFPVIDFLRVAVGLDTRVASSLATPSSQLGSHALLKAVIQRTSAVPDPSSLPKPVALTVLRLLSNCLTSPLLASTIVSDPGLRTSSTKILLNSLLAKDEGIRKCAAGLAWSVVAFVWSGRTEWISDDGELISEDEDWGLEICAALLEAIQREQSLDVVHRLAATLGLFLYLSPHYSSFEPLLEVLEAKQILAASANVNPALRKLLKEVGQLTQSNW